MFVKLTQLQNRSAKNIWTRKRSVLYVKWKLIRINWKSAYVRQQGFSDILKEKMVKNFVRDYGKITRSDVPDYERSGI